MDDNINKGCEMKHKRKGRQKLFETPDEMLRLFDLYVAWCKENPWHTKEAIKSGDRCGDIIEIETERPITIVGFASYLCISKRSLSMYGSQESYSEYHEAYQIIKDYCEEHNVSGAMCGIYKERLTARVHGISENQNINHTGLPTPPSKFTVELVDRADVLKEESAKGVHKEKS